MSSVPVPAVTGCRCSWTRTVSAKTIGITAMGNEGTQWIGMEPFVESEHLFQNYGDGTLFHSGQLAIQNCIAAGKHMTFKILYNSTVAMTGGQDSRSALSVPALVDMVMAWGVAKVAITTEDPSRYTSIGLPSAVQVYDRTQITTVQEDLRSTPGVTVLIHDQECAAELRRDRRRGRIDTPTTRIVINERICEGCGDCGDVSNCLSVQPVQTPFGRKTRIDQASCNFDYSCLGGDCPAFMVVEVDADIEVEHSAPADQPVPLVEPPSDPERQVVRIRLAGIGGTGVVTIAQLIGTAAMLDGWSVQGLDQTGLSQKAGPVVSDVTLTRDGATSSNLIGRGEVDLVLAFDSLVAASDSVIKGLGSASQVIAATQEVPTGRMIAEPTLAYPSGQIDDRLSAVVQADAITRLAAGEISAAVAGSRTQSNTVVLGAAIQSGYLPLTIASVERAIELNGVAVEQNRLALSAGRQAVNDSAQSYIRANVTTQFATPIDPEVERTLLTWDIDASLASTIGHLATDLIGYQDRSYASRYLSHVRDGLAAEVTVAGKAGRLTEAVATSMHKLMAYKDEYEVARLMLLPDARAAVDAVGGPNASFLVAAASADAEVARSQPKALVRFQLAAHLHDARQGQTPPRHEGRSVRPQRDASSRTPTSPGVCRHAAVVVQRSDTRQSRRAGRHCFAPGHDPRIRGSEATTDRRV